MVLSTGGGAYMQSEIRQLIHQKAIAIWLKAEPPELHSRIKHETHRPLIVGKESLEKLKKLARERYPVYQKADITIESDGLSSQQTLEAIINALYNYLQP